MGGRPDDPELPEGVLTFLLTDIEGSTPRWAVAERLGMRQLAVAGPAPVAAPR